MHLKAPRDDCSVLGAGRWHLEFDETVLPAGGSDHGFWSDPMRVIVVGVMEAGPVADRTIDFGRSVWITPREDIHFERPEEGIGCVRELRKHGLATDDDSSSSTIAAEARSTCS